VLFISEDKGKYGPYRCSMCVCIFYIDDNETEKIHILEVITKVSVYSDIQLLNRFKETNVRLLRVNYPCNCGWASEYKIITWEEMWNK